MTRENALTLEDVMAAQGAYGEPIAASVWNYGYTVRRCKDRGFYDDAKRYTDTVRRILNRCTPAARAYCLAQYRLGRWGVISPENKPRPVRWSVDEDGARFAPEVGS